jgi:hypothetical protein
MSQFLANTVENSNVVVSLQPGPKGTFRLSYEIPKFEMQRPLWQQQLGPRRQFASSYAPSAIEIDPEKLRKLQFSKDELAEIGFSLVKQLWQLRATTHQVA